jgi:outer membrane lipoprotein-sorting protein
MARKSEPAPRRAGGKGFLLVPKPANLPIRLGAVLLLAAACAWSASPAPRMHGQHAPDAPSAPQNNGKHTLSEILARMDEQAHELKTVTADLEYTKVTVVVNDHSTEYGRIYFRKGRSPEVLLQIEKPDTKVLLFHKKHAEIYTPRTNQIQEYNLESHSNVLQQFLLLGFGTESAQMQDAYRIKLLREDHLEGIPVAVLELVPRSTKVAAQLSKVELWVSENSWLPVQQQFFEPGGDYMLARYSAMKVNRPLPSSTFRIRAPKDVKRLQMD